MAKSLTKWSAASHSMRLHHLLMRLADNGALFLVVAMFMVGTSTALAVGIPVRNVMSSYAYDVLVILVVMELFTNLIVETGIMQLIAIKITAVSQGKKRLCLILFGAMMFLVSSCLNNVTAVLIILPVVSVMLKTLEVDRKYVCRFFAVILALSNTGGAATPIGDAPAVIVMSSGITKFLSYLVRAFPLFALTSVALLTLWGACTKREKGDGTIRLLAVRNLHSQYKNMVVRFDVLKWLGIIFVGMFFAWSCVPQKTLPPETIAVLGYVSAMTVCAIKGVKVNQAMDLKSVLMIASFLYVAEVISETGVLNMIALLLQSKIANPKLLVMAIMVITSLVAGLFSAGPAASALLPIVVDLCKGPLGAQADWIAVAFAASICAGSSLFMWSASAGFIISNKVNQASVEDEHNRKVIWGVAQYLKYGLVNYIVQLSIALITILVVL